MSSLPWILNLEGGGDSWWKGVETVGGRGESELGGKLLLNR